jgi:uncharacterized protein YndB with AHSA1/START domain
MQITVASQFPVTDAACKQETGRTLKEWFDHIDGLGDYGRRNTVAALYNEFGRSKEWWATTIPVEYERARQMLKKDGLPEGYGICATKTIAAAVPTVYAAWSDAKAFAKWFGDGLKAKITDGGEFSDGAGNTGTFTRVRADKDLRFSFENAKLSSPTLVDVMFADKGAGKTLVTLNHTRIQTRAEADGLRAAWGEAFDRLKKQVEG